MNQKPLVKMSKEEREEAKRRLAYLVRQIQNEMERLLMDKELLANKGCKKGDAEGNQ